MPPDIRSADDIVGFIARQPRMMDILRRVAALELPDCWIGAGAEGVALGGALYRPGDSAAEVAAKGDQIVAAWNQMKRNRQ